LYYLVAVVVDVRVEDEGGTAVSGRRTISSSSSSSKFLYCFSIIKNLNFIYISFAAFTH
jgi:hypothetical protein